MTEIKLFFHVLGQCAQVQPTEINTNQIAPDTDISGSNNPTSVSGGDEKLRENDPTSVSGGDEKLRENDNPTSVSGGDEKLRENDNPTSVSGGDEKLRENDPEDVFRISLDRGPRDELGFRGLGFRIRRGRTGPEKSHFSILSIYDDGPAYGKLRVDDEILEINGESTKNLSHADGIKLIQAGYPKTGYPPRYPAKSGSYPDKVEMLIKRFHGKNVFAVEKILEKRFNQNLGRVM